MRGPSAADEGNEDRRPVAVALDWLRGAFLDNIALKFVALVLALTVFILVNTNEDAVIGVTVGVSYTMPRDRVLVSEPVDHVRLSVKGAWRRIKRFDEREMKKLHVDLRDVRGGEYTFAKEAIRLPEGLELLSIEPPSIPLRFEPAAEKTVKVEVPIAGQPQAGFKVERVVVKPSQIRVWGAESVIRDLQSIPTRELDLTGRQLDMVEVLPLVPPEPAPMLQLIDDVESVEVDVDLTEEMATRKLKDVAVALRPGPGLAGPVPARLAVKPASVDVILHGPRLTIESLDGKIIAFVEILPGDVESRAPRPLAVQIESPPEGVGVEVVPHTVTLQTRRPE